MVLSNVTQESENGCMAPLVRDVAVTATTKRDSSGAARSGDHNNLLSRPHEDRSSDAMSLRVEGASSSGPDRKRMTVTQQPRRSGGGGEEEPHETRSALSETAEAPPRIVADAALVARGAIKSGYLWKMGANVPKWKRRFFVLKPITMLFYYMSEYDTEPRGCIDLDLFDAIRKIEDVASNSGDSSSPSSRSTSKKSCSSSSNTQRVDGTRSGNTTSRSSSSTTFELYRSGCTGGSGFMLEARGNEDWEQWVEAIANGRHDKMQAELEVVKGANKLLLEEISGLEQQVATFRGYADQRHVTVLALRDERQRSRELASEVSELASVASTIPGLIAADLKRERRGCCGARAVEGVGATAARAKAAEAADCRECARDCPERRSREMLAESLSADADAGTLGSSVAVGGFTAGTSAAAATGSIDSPSPSAFGAADTEDGGELPREGGEATDERRALRTIRSSLLEARAELKRRGKALAEERAGRRAAEGRIADAEQAVQAAEECVSTVEATARRAKGRVSVLERNVEFLRGQHRGLRAELGHAREKLQVIRAQKALLKREIRDLWSKKSAAASASASATTSSRTRRSAATTVEPSKLSNCPSSRSRTWSLMGDLARIQADTSVRGRSRSTGAASPGAREEEGQEAEGGVSTIRRVLSSRSSCAGEGVQAATSDGGATTDLAESTGSEASYEGCENEAVTGNEFHASVRRSILKRVGSPRVPPLPASRHLRTLKATKSARSCGAAGRETEVAAGGVSASSALASASSSISLPATGMAGLLLGLRKGVVDKAAQEMGKTLALWPSGVTRVSSLGSLSTAASSQVFGSSATPSRTLVEESPPASRSAKKLDPVGAAPADPAPAGGMGSAEDVGTYQGGCTSDASTKANEVAAADDARPLPTLAEDDASRPRVSSVTSRTALIQLSDLELAEPCDGSAKPTGACESTLPPRPDEHYELLFTTRVIGLQFKELAGSGGVVVQGRNGYVGPSPTGVPGERLHPEIGDALESYNGISARGKSTEVVAAEISQCGRPLRLGFRSAGVDSFPSQDADGPKDWWASGAEEGRDCPPFSHRHQNEGIVSGSPWGVRGDGGGSCREALDFPTSAHPWTISS